MAQVLRLSDVERDDYQRILIQLLRNERRYQNVVQQDLRSLWKKVGWASPTPGLPTWRDVYDQFRPRCDNHISTYVNGLRQSVIRLGFITSRGREGHLAAAGWVVGFVHADVTAHPDHGPLDDGGSTVYGEEYLTLTTRVSPAIAQLEWQTLGRVGEEILREEGRQTLQAERFLGLNEWDDLKRKLHDITDAWVDEAAQHFRRTYPHRDSGVEKKRLNDIEQLFRHLYHHEPIPDRAERERLRRLAKLIGLDFPAQK